MPNVLHYFAYIGKWIRRQKLRIQHDTTIDQYRKELFHLQATIGIGDALTEGILDPRYLRGPFLLQMMPKLDVRVWSAWNESSRRRLQGYKKSRDANSLQLNNNLSSVYRTLLPFEELIKIANDKAAVAVLQWLYTLENPWRSIEWEPATLLGEHQCVGKWTLDTFAALEISKEDAQYLASHFLCTSAQSTFSQVQPSKWIYNVQKKSFTLSGWPQEKPEQASMRTYMVRVLNVLLPPAHWNWKRRWDAIGQYMPLVASSDKNKQAPLSLCQGTMMAALLDEAPKHIQMILCAFKGARHPDEPEEGNREAQFVRHHFFANERPISTAPAPFLFMDGTDPNVEANFVLDQLLRNPQETMEIYSLDSMAL